ncbi:hypothetical protein AALP_AAs45999U000500 [Arabis alpina]|uniref:Uncharacterized protein n=1 Tax=Arabis alpina TaxID=50452 RepID=A0A087G0M0_ARAAL|nr:hypothetical protein AALP_AAs45999U000500 [Arabis alpina]
MVTSRSKLNLRLRTERRRRRPEQELDLAGKCRWLGDDDTKERTRNQDLSK